MTLSTLVLSLLLSVQGGTTGIVPQAVWRSGAPSSGTQQGGALRPALPPRGTLAPRLASVPLPDQVDLSGNTPPVGDQGPINSCSAWAVGYSLRGWYATRDRVYPLGGFAPMYLYTQVENPPGSNTGTYLADNLGILQTQGIAPEAFYPWGTMDYWDLPPASSIAAAASYRTGGNTLFLWPGEQGAQLQAETELAGGQPFVIVIPVDRAFHGAGRATAFIAGLSDPGAVGTDLYHAVMVEGYDSSGVWIVNQWGTAWGLNGHAEISWDYLTRYAFGYALTLATATATPTSTPSPTSTATPLPTRTPTETATASPTATPRPTMTATGTAIATLVVSPLSAVTLPIFDTPTAQPSALPSPAATETPLPGVMPPQAPIAPTSAATVTIMHAVETPRPTPRGASVPAHRASRRVHRARPHPLAPRAHLARCGLLRCL